MDEYAEALDEILPEGWSHDADIFGMECSLWCPHGHQIELDGTCHEGCVSPLRAMGMI